VLEENLKDILGDLEVKRYRSRGLMKIWQSREEKISR
jgi:hypothetical protein